MSNRPVRGLNVIRGRMQEWPSRLLCTLYPQDISKKSDTCGSGERCEGQGGVLAPGWNRMDAKGIESLKKAGLAPFRFHDLRHTFASRLAMQGCNDRTIMELGGWGSPRMLKRYAHVAPAHLWQAIEGLTRTGTGSKTGSVEVREVNVAV